MGSHLKSVLLAAAGLLGALGILLGGRRTSSDDLRAVATDLDALIRESAAGVKERADTLAQLPRIGWAVATDEATVRDLTNDELAFRTHPGEHIEITQMRRGDGEPRRLLRRPADSDVDLPLMVGTHVVVRQNHLQLVTVVSIEPRERAELMVGLLAVAKQLDTAAIEQRLAARRINAEVRTIQGSVVLAGTAPAAAEATIALTGPAAEGTELVASNLGRARWPFVAAPLVLVLSLAGAALLWRREAAPALPMPFEDRPSSIPPADTTAARADVPVEPAPPPPHLPPAPRPTLPAPGVRPTAAEPAEGRPSRAATPPVGAPAAGPAHPPPPRPPTPALGTPPPRLPTPALGARLPPPGVRGARPKTPPQGGKATPVAGMPAIPTEAIPDVVRERALSGRVEISLSRTGSVSLPGRGAAAPGAHADPNAEADPRTDVYRALFAEYVKLRRTTGESVDDLDVTQFVETLREKRAQIMKQIPVRDVQFKLAFHNGKAAIRYLTVT